MTDVTIVAGGWSVRDVNLEKLVGTVIAVNDSAIHLPRWDYALSMDRLWTESRLTQVIAAATPPREVWLRRSAVQNISNLDRFPCVTVFECDHLTNMFPLREDRDPPRLNGMNSGVCALNLAHRLRPERLFLLGFDMRLSAGRQAYWYQPYPWAASTGSGISKYTHWSKFFPEVATQFDQIGTQVFNVSPLSAITLFPKLRPDEYARLQE